MTGRREPQRAIAPGTNLLLVADQALGERHAAAGGSRNPRCDTADTIRRLRGSGERRPNIAHRRPDSRQERPGFDRDAVMPRRCHEREGLDRGFLIAGLPIETADERQPGAAAEVAVAHQVRGCPSTSQRGFRFLESLLIGPHDTDAHGRRDAGGAIASGRVPGVRGQCSRSLERRQG